MSGRRVLIVDDDPDILEVLSLVLTSCGYEVRTALEGRTALDLLQAGFRPGLIILDLMMPGMDGWQLREKLLDDAALATIPVVIFSGDPRALRLEPPPRVAQSWRKPLDVPTLLGDVDQYCQQAS